MSNSDNLGATLDLDLLAYFARTDKGFLMEVGFGCWYAADAPYPQNCVAAGFLVEICGGWFSTVFANSCCMVRLDLLAYFARADKGFLMALGWMPSCCWRACQPTNGGTGGCRWPATQKGRLHSFALVIALHMLAPFALSLSLPAGARAAGERQEGHGTLLFALHTLLHPSTFDHIPPVIACRCASGRRATRRAGTWHAARQTGGSCECRKGTLQWGLRGLMEGMGGCRSG